MVSVFHGSDEETHQRFQAWRKAHVDGFHMTESGPRQFTIHYTQDKRENRVGRGCIHQGGGDNEYLVDDGCYTRARKVCSDSLAELIAWATEHGFASKNCKDCDTERFPFPAVAPQVVLLPEEVTASGELIEGAVCQVVINAYERNPIARARCIAHYGRYCVVCGFDFGIMYGPLAEGFIHVHHAKPLSEIGAEYEVDPVADLRPVCPNCHAVIHLGGECRGIEEVRQLLHTGTTPNKAPQLTGPA